MDEFMDLKIAGLSQSKNLLFFKCRACCLAIAA